MFLLRNKASIKIFVIGVKFIILIANFLIIVSLSRCGIDAGSSKFTVIGTAFVMKHQAGIRTDDNRLYYLYGVDDWDEKYNGKKVKVTGRRMTLPPPVKQSPDPGIKIPPQPKVRDGEYIKNAKWKLVK